MIASRVTFDQMRHAASSNPKLGVPTSYLQVEYGLAELEACWDGFVQTSDDLEITFKNKKHVCSEFADALHDYLNFLGESVPDSLGQEISSHR